MSIPFCLPAMKKNEGDGVKRVPGCRENHPVAAHHGQFKGKRNENVRQKKSKGKEERRLVSFFCFLFVGWLLVQTLVCLHSCFLCCGLLVGLCMCLKSIDCERHGERECGRCFGRVWCCVSAEQQAGACGNAQRLHLLHAAHGSAARAGPACSLKAL